MAIDGLSHDPDEIPEPDPALPADKPQARPSPDRDPGRADQPPRVPAPDKDPEKAELTRAVGELAAENADLYNKVDRLTADLKTEKARFSAWSKEVTSRDNALHSRIDDQAIVNEALATRLADLEAKQTDKAEVGGTSESQRRVRTRETAEKETDEATLDRRKPSNEFIAVGVAVGGGALTLAGMVVGTTPAMDATGLAISAIGIAGAGIPWVRKFREGGNADRPED
jgi:hypothetical protein